MQRWQAVQFRELTWIPSVPPVDAVGAALDAPPALHAPDGVDADPVAGREASDHHATTLPITGSPAAGIVIDSTQGSIARIAASSLEM